MTMSHVEGPWAKRVAMARRAGLALGFVGFGALGQSVIDQSGRLPQVEAAAAVAPVLAAKLDSTQHELAVIKCETWLVQCAEAYQGELGNDKQ